MREQLARLLGATTWLLAALSLTVQVGGLLGRPLLLAAVPSGSMAPALQPGDLIVVLPTWLATAVRVGDIVVFRTEAEPHWLVHRVVGGDARTGFITRGDANSVSDPDRVLPRHLAGVVPVWQGRPMRLPLLGLLNRLPGLVPTPVLGAVGLVGGVYLLVGRLGGRGRRDRRPGRPAYRHRGCGRRPPARPEAALLTYLGLGFTTFLTTLFPALNASSTEQVQYEIVSERHTSIRRVGEYLAGTVQTQAFPIRNPSPLPTLVVFVSTDPYLTYQPAWAVVPPRGETIFTATLDRPPVGSHRSRLQVGMYLPLLPPAWLAALARRHTLLAAVTAALTPVLVVGLMAGLDRRCRTAVTRMSRRMFRAAL